MWRKRATSATEQGGVWSCGQQMARKGASLSSAVIFGLFTSVTSAAQASSRAPSVTNGPDELAAHPSVKLPQAMGSLEVEYPAGAAGSASVSLELHISRGGEVIEAVAESAAEPFGSAAEQAALGWRFIPAQQRTDSGVWRYVAAKIHVDVQFHPPSTSPGAPAPVGQRLGPLAAVPEEHWEEGAPGARVEVTVEGLRAESTHRLSREEVRQIPGAFGDPFRAVEALPGVTPVASGLPYFYVRGAPPGNAGYYFDGISVPALYHAAVGPGVIHPAFTSSVELYSGGAPVRYGRSAGAVLAAESAAPSGNLRGEVGLRLVDAGGFVEIPFAEEAGSMPRRLSRPARQVWRFGKAFASTGAERTKVREHPRAAKTKPKPKIAGRAGSLRYRG